MRTWLMVGAILLAAAEPKTGKSKRAAAKTAVFYVPAGTKVLDKKIQHGIPGGGDFLLRKGAHVELDSGPGMCIVEAGARVSLENWSGTLVVKKGGVVARAKMGSPERFRICYEKGARIPTGLGKPIVLEEYDTITIAPLPGFTLRGTLRDDDRNRPGVVIHFYAAHDGAYLGDAVTDRGGVFEYHPPRSVGRLIADLGEQWSRHPAVRDDLKFRRRVCVLRGWETLIKDGCWEKDATIPMHHSARAEMALPPPAILLGHEKPVRRLLYSRDGATMVTISSAARPCVWDVKSRKVLRRFALKDKETWLTTLSPDGKVLASFGASGIRLWDVTTGEQRCELLGVPKPMNCAAVSPDGRLLALGNDNGSIYLCEAATGKVKFHFQAHPMRVDRLQFSRDGRLLYSTGHKPFRRHGLDWRTCDAVRAWDTRTGMAVRAFPLEAMIIGQSADGSMLAGAGVVATIEKTPGGLNVSGGDFIYIWDGRTEQRVAQVPGWADTLAFTPGNHLLLTASAGTIQVWEAATGQEVLRCPLPQLNVRGLSFSPDGRTLATGQEGGHIYLWDVRLSQLYVPEDRTCSAAKWGQFWTDLASSRAAKAYRSLWTLRREPTRAVTLLRKRLRPAARESREAGRRPGDPEELRSSRAIYLLEDIGSPAARAVLQTLAKGAKGARQTREARAALARLEK